MTTLPFPKTSPIWENLSLGLADNDYQNEIIKILRNARESAIFRFYSLYFNNQDVATTHASITDIQRAKDYNLYQLINSKKNSIIMKKITSLIPTPDKHMDGIAKQMKDNNKDACIFSHLSFPQLFFCFLTKEMNILGAKFIISSIPKCNLFFNQNLLASYFDNFGNFVENLWMTIPKKLMEGKTVFCSFVESLHESWYFLTEMHTKVIKFWRSYNRAELAHALFLYYFPMHLNQSLFVQNNDPILQDYYQKMQNIFTFIYSNPDCALFDVILDAMSSDEYDQKRNLSFTANIDLHLLYSILSPAEVNILWMCFNGEDDEKDPLFKEYMRYSLVPAIIKFSSLNIIEKGDVVLSNMMFDNKEIELMKVPTDKEDKIALGMSKIKGIANETVNDLYSLLTIKQKKDVERRLYNALSIDPCFKDYLQSYLDVETSKAKRTFGIEITHAAAIDQIKTIGKSFETDIAVYLGLHTNDYVISQYVDHFIAQLEEFSVNSTNFAADLYADHIKETTKCLPDYKYNNLINIHKMKGNSIDRNIKTYNGSFSDPNFNFFFVISLINCWSQSILFDMNFSKCMQHFIKYLRQKLISSPRAKLLKSKLYMDVIEDIRAADKLKEGWKIYEVIRIVRNVMEVCHDNSIECIHDCIVASGCDDFLQPFFWYSRLLIYFPMLVKNDWLQPSGVINSIKDTFIVEISQFNQSLLNFINMFYFDERNSPLSL